MAKKTKTQKRVLITIPAGNGVPVERVSAVSMDAALEMVQMGAQDKNCWYAGATVIDDPKEYPRYGYKECPENGVLRDEESKHRTKVLYQNHRAALEKIDKLEPETKGEMSGMMKAMEARIQQLEGLLDQSEQQQSSEQYAETKQLTSDMELVTE